MKSLAIIPARSGSKRLPGKNMQKINGKTLVDYAVETAVNSNVFSEIIVTSDSKEILDSVSNYNQIFLHLRPPSLSGDSCKLRTLVKYLAELYAAEDNLFDAIALIIPTSPLRIVQDIRRAAESMEIYFNVIDGVMSVTKVRYPPQHTLKINEFIEPMFPEDIDAQSQYLEPAYIHDGSIIFVKTESFMKYEDFYMPKMMPYYISEYRAIDINTIFDLKIAEYLLMRQPVVR